MIVRDYLLSVLVLVVFCVALVSTYQLASFYDNKSIDYKNFTVTSKSLPPITTGHESVPADKKFFEEVYSGVNEQYGDEQSDDRWLIKGVIVNHHLLAPDLIAREMNTIATDEELTVVLVAPNHFGRGDGAITTTDSNWLTPYGAIEPDRQLMDNLVNQGVLTKDDYPFTWEHGIFNITGFIKRSLPNARIVPIIFRDGANDEEVDALANHLSQAKGKIIIVSSLDFSHTLTKNAAILHDQHSRVVISNFDYDAVNSVDIDSKPALRFTLKYMDAVGARQFSLSGNTNSAAVIGDDSLSDVTSYIVGHFNLGEGAPNRDVTLLFFGDMMLDRNVRKIIDDKGLGHILQPIARLLDGNDLTIANLEGPLTDSPSLAENLKKLIFTFDPRSTSVLKKFKFDVLSLANNHTFNFGSKGLTQTRDHLRQAGIDYFGDPNNAEQLSVIKEVRGTKVAFVGFHQFGSNHDKVTTEIRRVRPLADMVIVMPHWGIEYKADFSAGQQQLAHGFIDAGADVVIGAHPHVIEPIEIYKGKTIFYSLGNFIFDQYFSTETQRGLAVGMVFGRTEPVFYLLPLNLEGRQVKLLDYAQSAIILDNIAKNSAVSTSTRDMIRDGIINIITQ